MFPKTIDNPNFSIVLPGECNANCSFCMYKKTHIKSHGCGAGCDVKEKFLRGLDNALKNLPKHFTQISITGGEPTWSTSLTDALDLIREYKRTTQWNKVVLNTNASNLDCHYVEDIVDYVNISRHAIDDKENEKIFQTQDIPTQERLAELCQDLNKNGIHATINAVIHPINTHYKAIFDFIDFAKRCNANSVCFRKLINKQHNNLEPTGAEKYFVNNKYRSTYKNECSVCRINEMNINGMTTYWKAGLFEPSINTDEDVFEVILQPTGKMTIDWAGKIPFKHLDDTSCRSTEDELRTEINKLQKEIKRLKDQTSKPVATQQLNMVRSTYPAGSCHRSRPCG